MTDDIRDNSSTPPQMESDTSSTRVSNELPMDYSNDSNALRAEFREMQESAMSAYSKKMAKYKIQIIICVLIFSLSIVGLIVNNSQTLKNGPAQDQPPAQGDNQNPQSDLIETAKLHLTESSLKKLIEENTHPSVDTQTSGRLSTVETVLASLQEGQAKQMEMLSELKAVSESLKSQVAAHETSIAAISKKLETAPTLNTRPVVIQRDSTSFAPAKSRVRKVPDPAKKSEPVIEFPPVRLVSIKNFNGKSGVTLSLSSNNSGLVLVGQTWRGFMVIAADSSTRSATIARDGQVKNLSL